MVIELQFNSVSIQPAEMQEDYSHIFSNLQSYIPIQKSPKRRRVRKKRETVAHLIDSLIEDIERGHPRTLITTRLLKERDSSLVQTWEV